MNATVLSETRWTTTVTEGHHRVIIDGPLDDEDGVYEFRWACDIGTVSV